nr:MAG: chaperone of endosialidase [Bacteriophage sp.]
MAINKKLIHFNKKATFNSQKLSANDSNTQYQVGGTGTVQTGAPDINYQSIVYIKDSKEIWTHGQFYATAVTWSTITGKPSFATVATSGSYNDLSNKPTIPTSLPTPNSLTFTGATTGTWNGSAAKTVNIPTYSNASTSSAGLMSASDKSKLNGIASGAEVNQNAFSNVVVGSTTIAADSKTDTLTLTAGSNITLTPNATNDSITISASGSSYSLPLASNSTRGGIKLSSSTQGGTPNGITTTSGRTYAVQINSSEQAVVNVPWTDTNTTYSEATTSTSGLMSSSDKTKLNSLASNMIKSRNSYVQCNMSDDNIDVYAPGCNVTVQSDIFLVTSPQVEFNENVSIMNGSLNLVSGDITTQSGSISSTGGFFDISDARAKTNVKEIDASKADKVKLVEFDRTDVEHHGYGVIAQELEKVYPEMVNTDSEGFKSVNYNELAMVKIKYLEDKVARLEALVGRLLAE